ncbi:MAG: cytochrome c oxidase subunit II [Rhodospirillales bacterium]|nr:cytochrome c oxidase subunit II [Rhodospirillales bacterium]MBN8904149.1 cytochrome c oxidase subunit II [Rhodospirillales bacterium]
MWKLLPDASSSAWETDGLLAGLTLVTGAVLLLVFWLMLVYAIRYRDDSPIDRGKIAEKTFRFEISWTIATLVIFFGLFVWGADLYARLSIPPKDADQIFVVAKQWMWKVEHPGGQKEINALHVPVNTPIELVMTSEDVIHDFFVPAFRIKRDVLPGQYETMWFTAELPGTYHLFCAQFCGTDHAAMIGQVVVQTQSDFANWLAQNGTSGTLAQQGAPLFIRYGCSGCHSGNGTVRAPSLAGLYGSPVPLSDGSVTTADDRYLRDAILQPKRQVVAGFDPVMPSFAGVIPEEDLIRLIAFIQSLSPERPR